MANAPLPPTYITLDELDDYFEWRFVTDAYDDATPLQRQKAIVSATQAIDRLNFAGLRTSDFNRFKNAETLNGVVTLPTNLAPSSVYPSPGQPLEFPRNGYTGIPADIKNACCEIAYALLDGVDPEMEMQALGTTTQRFAAAHVSYDATFGRMAIRHGIPSYSAWLLLYPYLVDPSEVTLKRVT